MGKRSKKFERELAERQKEEREAMPFVQALEILDQEFKKTVNGA